MLSTPVLGLEYHRIRRQVLMRSFRPIARRWEHRERDAR
jgi:hypothetical protein